MYSGTTLTKYSGRILGTHQKIDRVARRHLGKLLEDNDAFPSTGSILQFEGKNGPDAIKRKSPAQDEPWHYFDPFDMDNSDLIDIIQDHYDILVKNLRSNSERAAFEAAWLAHAIVDGLTPAHHYPYEEKLVELLGGAAIGTRTTLKGKLVMPGGTTRERVANNWKMWGPGGLMTSHGLFEMGIAMILAPLTMNEAVPTPKQIEEVSKIGVGELFHKTAQEIAHMKLYDNYRRKGWTPRLAQQIRHKLGPLIVRTVTLAWYAALADSGLIAKNSTLASPKAPTPPDRLISAESGLSSLDAAMATSPSAIPLSARADSPWERGILGKSSKKS